MRLKLLRKPIRAGLFGGAAILAAGLVTTSPVAAQSATVHLAGPASIKKVTSKAWSGYVDTNHEKVGTFHNVAASWNVPEIPDSACPAGSYGLRVASVYAGLGGWSTHTQELAGTQSRCDDGTFGYTAFTETPDSITVSFGVNPGDHMSAYVDYSSGRWLLSIVDATSGKSITQLFACPSGFTCKNYSAEVVVAAVGGCVASSGQRCNGAFYPLADYDYVVFRGISDATSKVGGSLGTSSFGPEEITAKRGKIVMTEVTKPLKSDGFQDSWKFSGATG
jgi:hypothetical protein